MINFEALYHLLLGTRKATENFNQYRQPPSQKPNSRLPEYEAGLAKCSRATLDGYLGTEVFFN